MKVLIMEYSSKNSVAFALGIPKITFERHINLKNHSVYSSVLERDVFLIDSLKPLSENSPIYFNTEDIMLITGIDLYKLEQGKLFALLLDKKTIFEIYDNPSKAAQILDDKSESRYISKYINLERLVLVGPDKEPVYFVMNPEWKVNLNGRVGARLALRKKSNLSKSIVLVNILNSTALQFDTVSDMSKYLGKKSILNTGFV